MPAYAARARHQTMRPRPAARIDGSSALVSATGPMTWVENICCHSVDVRLLDHSGGGDAGVVHQRIRARRRPLRSPWRPPRSTRRRRGRAGRRSAGRRPLRTRSPHAAAAVPRRACASPRPRAIPRGRGARPKRSPRPAGRAGDDDAARLSHSALSGAQPIAPGYRARRRAGRPAGRYCQVDHLPTEYGPSAPSFS